MILNIKTFLAGAAIAATVAAFGLTAAQAEDRPDRPQNGRGKGRFFEEKFQEADANNDGKITFSEFKTSHEKRMKERFDKADSDSDGAIDKDEMKNLQQEMQKKFKEFRQRREQRPGGQPGGGPGGPPDEATLGQ